MPNYSDFKRTKDENLIYEYLEDLPYYVKEYVISEQNKGLMNSSILSYIQDINGFFSFEANQPGFKGKRKKDFSISDLEKLTVQDINEWIRKTSSYTTEKGHQITTSDVRNKRKICSLKTFFSFLRLNKYIVENPFDYITTPKVVDKEIIIVSPEDISLIYQAIYEEECGSLQMRVALEKTRTRDIAIITTLFGTGIRVSELVGLDLSDLDLDDKKFVVTRKGGKTQTIYFSEAVRDAIEIYLEDRDSFKPDINNDDALFLSLHHKRISVRSVQNLFDKYKKRAGLDNKKITPHKARSTYGSFVYAATNDIYVTSASLGHSSVDVTAKHYAKMPEDKLRKAALEAERLLPE